MPLTKVKSAGVDDNAITTQKLPDNAVTNAKLTDLSVGTAQLFDSSVTSAKVATGAISKTKLNSDVFASSAEMTAGTVTDKASSPNAVKTYVDAAIAALTPQVLIVHDVRGPSTYGGTAVAAQWNARVLNTVVKNTISGASLASNAITLPAGKYLVKGRTPAYGAGGAVSRLISGSTILTVSSSNYCNTSVQIDMQFLDELVLLTPTTFTLQTYVDSAGGGQAEFGTYASGSNVNSIYTQLEFTKIPS